MTREKKQWFYTGRPGYTIQRFCKPSNTIRYDRCKTIDAVSQYQFLSSVCVYIEYPIRSAETIKQYCRRFIR